MVFPAPFCSICDLESDPIGISLEVQDQVCVSGRWPNTIVPRIIIETNAHQLRRKGLKPHEMICALQCKQALQGRAPLGGGGTLRTQCMPMLTTRVPQELTATPGGRWLLWLGTRSLRKGREGSG